MNDITLRDLIAATVHIGHIKSRWVPAMAPYIWGVKNNIHLIDVSKTKRQLEQAAQFLTAIAAQNSPILWIGTKKSAQDVIKRNAVALQSPHVTHRWIGGTLTNFSQVKKSVTKLLHYEDIATKADEYLYTKKEINKFQKLAEALRRNVGGIRKLNWPIGAIVVVDVKKEQAAIKEAIKAGIPIVAMVDTNSDPSGIDYVIPSNDDAPRSIKIIIDYLAQAVQRGQEQAAQKTAPVKETERTEAVAPQVIITPQLEEEEEEATTESKKAAVVKKKAPKKPMLDEEEAEGAEKASRKNVKKSPVKAKVIKKSE